MIRHAVRIGAAVLCVAVATILVLLAVDAQTWRATFAADDLRYRRDASLHRLWRPTQLTPFGLAPAVLGINDDLAYRSALRQFRMGRPLEALGSPDSARHRVSAEVAMATIMEHGGDPVRKSQVANLLGVLGFSLTTQDFAERAALINNAIGAFREATILDPGNNDAFYNLEYALNQIKSGGEQQAQGSDRTGQAGTAGLRNTGHGY